MNHLPSDIRLTDELERQLMQAAIEEQNRIKPGVALKKLFVKLGGKVNKSTTVNVAPRRNVESAA
jgi:hypothetical protein